MPGWPSWCRECRSESGRSPFSSAGGSGRSWWHIHLTEWTTVIHISIGGKSATHVLTRRTDSIITSFHKCKIAILCRNGDTDDNCCSVSRIIVKNCKHIWMFCFQASNLLTKRHRLTLTAQDITQPWENLIKTCQTTCQEQKPQITLRSASQSCCEILIRFLISTHTSRWTGLMWFWVQLSAHLCWTSASRSTPSDRWGRTAAGWMIPAAPRRTTEDLSSKCTRSRWWGKHLVGTDEELC